MTGDTQFQRYLPDPHPDTLVAPEQIRRHILCSGSSSVSFVTTYSCTHSIAGQVYHTLLQEREDRGIYDVAISRLEQISPFPYDLVSDALHLGIVATLIPFPQLTPHLDKYPNADLVWCQVGYIHVFRSLVLTR